MSVLKVVAIGRVKFKKVKKRVKAEYKNEWGERVTLEYTSGHRKRSGRPRWGYDRSGEVKVKRIDTRLSFGREVISKESMRY